MRRHIFAVMAFAVILCSCEKADVDCGKAPDPALEPVFTATTADEAQTRTSLDSTFRVIWSTDDSISIFKGTVDNRKYRLKEGEGTTHGTFKYSGWISHGSDSLNEALNIALYPYDAAATITTDFKITTSIPSLQHYTEGTFENGAALMTAKSTGTALSFKNSIGLLRLKFSKVDSPTDFRVKSVTITSGSLNIAGGATIDMSADDCKAVVSNSGAVKSITLDCGENGISAASLDTDVKNLYMVVPAVTFPASDLEFSVQLAIDDSLKTYKFSNSSTAVTVGRSRIITVRHTFDEDEFSGETEPYLPVASEEVADIESMNKFITDNPDAAIYNVTFSDIPNDAGKPGQGGAHAIVTTNLGSGNTLNVTVETETNTLYIGDFTSQDDTTLVTSGTNAATVNVNVPAGGSIGNLVINAPSKSVHLNGAQVTSAGTLTGVDATTSQNTLVVEANQEVGTLVLRQGGVKIHGTVNSVTIPETHGDIYVRDCEGLSEAVYAVLAPYIDTENGYVSKKNGTTYDIYVGAEYVARIGTKGYWSLKSAFEGAEEGQTIELLTDCTASETITVGKTVTLNLGNHTVTAGCNGYLFRIAAEEAGSTFTITGTDKNNCGHIVSNDTPGHEGVAAIVSAISGGSGDAVTFAMKYVKVHGQGDDESSYIGAGNKNQQSLICDSTSVSDAVSLRWCTVRTSSVILGGYSGRASASLNITGGLYKGAKGFRFAGTQKSVVDSAEIISTDGIAFYPYSTTDLKNSKITDTSTGSHDAVSVGTKGSVLTITNTSVETKSKTAVAAEYQAQAIIESGTFKCTTNTNGYAVFRDNTSGGLITVNGGTVDASGTQYAAYANTYSNSAPDDPAGIVFNGGTITGGSKGLAGVSSDHATVEINGGTYETTVDLYEGNTQWIRINEGNTAVFNEKVKSSSIVTIPGGTFKKAFENNDLASGSTITGGLFYEAAPYEGYIPGTLTAQSQGGDPESWILVSK